MRRVAAALVLLLLALGAAGCGGGSDDVVGPGTTAPGGETTVAGTDQLEGASTATVSAAATSDETALLTDVRAAPHEGFDRVVLEFRNVVPGYEVGYVERPVLADGSGDEVTVDGGFVVQIRMEPALDADLGQETAPPTYTGPQRFSPGLPEVVELVRSGGFEGVLTWAVGLAGRVDFRVTTLADPPRLVVDFRTR